LSRSKTYTVYNNSYSHDRTVRTGCRPAPYRRRHPEQTALYQVIQQHLETYFALAGEDDWDAQRVPAYVERAFRRYLECGILAYGFARARCPNCGQDFLVAFSCKGRGLCPSCNARRMAETAAHLVDHVIPPLPVRQWVLSVPKRLRWYLEREPQAVTAVLHILLRVIEAHLRQDSSAGSQARFGAVSFIHRFGASLNRHVHYHCCVIDGVFEPVEEADDVPQSARFRPAADLTPEALAAIAEQVRVRVLRWFARGGLIEPDDVREMRAPRSPSSPTADSLSMPRCAWARTIAPDWNGCCAIALARPSRSSAWGCSTTRASSIGCPSHSAMAQGR
jgi:hypothetical protein